MSSAKEGGLLPQEGDLEKVQEKKTTKEGGLLPQEGDLEKVQEKKKNKEGEKVAPRRKGSVCPQPRNFFFWFMSIWVLRDPSCLKYRLL